MTKFKIEIVAKDSYIVMVEADDEFKAKERVVTEICQEGWLDIKHDELIFIETNDERHMRERGFSSGGKMTPTLQYLDSVRDINVIDEEQQHDS